MQRKLFISGRVLLLFLLAVCIRSIFVNSESQFSLLSHNNNNNNHQQQEQQQLGGRDHRKTVRFGDMLQKLECEMGEIKCALLCVAHILTNELGVRDRQIDRSSACLPIALPTDIENWSYN